METIPAAPVRCIGGLCGGSPQSLGDGPPFRAPLTRGAKGLAAPRATALRPPRPGSPRDPSPPPQNPGGPHARPKGDPCRGGKDFPPKKETPSGAGGGRGTPSQPKKPLPPPGRSTTAGDYAADPPVERIPPQ